MIKWDSNEWNFEMCRVRRRRVGPSVSRGPHLPRQWKWILHSISEICLINEHAFQNILLTCLCDYLLTATCESMLLV